MYDPTIMISPYIADELGFFEAEGIKPVFTGTIMPGQHIPGLLAGNFDIAYLMITLPIGAIDSGAGVKCIVDGTSTTKTEPHMEFVVRENSGINEAKDMIGKKYGLSSFGSCAEFTPYEYLRKELGLTPEQAKSSMTMVTIQPGTEEQLLRSGEIDIAGYHGHPRNAFERGGLKIVFTDYDVWGEDGGAGPLYTTTKLINENPELIRRFVSAMAKTNNYMIANYDEARKAYAKRMGIDEGDIVFQGYSKDAVIRPETVQVWLDILATYKDGGLKKKDLKASDIYTNEFNPLSPDYKF
jgi:ABC-type nitrate/sulfonate/bicarbonate transport system substrate-binding protein